MRKLNILTKIVGMLIPITNRPPHHTLDDFFSRSHRECRGMWQLWEKVMEVVIVKIEKTDTMTNTWGRTKTKTSMPENEEELLIQCIQC